MVLRARQTISHTIGSCDLLETHRLAEVAPHVLRLTVMPAEVVQQILPERVLAILRERHALGVEPAADVGELDAHVARWITDQALGVLAASDRVEVAEELPAHERDAAVARAEILPGPVGDRPLADPGDDVLVDDVAGDPASARVAYRARPRRDALLLVGLGFLGHADERPGHRQHVFVVDGDAPLEVLSEEKSIRTKAHAPDGPQGVGLVGAFAYALVDEAVLEFIEAEL